MDFKHIIEDFKHKPFFCHGAGLCRVYKALFFVCLTIGKNCDTIQVRSPLYFAVRKTNLYYSGAEHYEFFKRKEQSGNL